MVQKTMRFSEPLCVLNCSFAMSVQAVLFSGLLSAAPVAAGDNFADDSAVVSVIQVSGTAVEIIVYDGDDMIGVLSEWVDPTTGAIHVSADFDDGYWDAIVDASETVIVDSSLSGEEMKRRGNAIALSLQRNTQTQRGYIGCGIAIGGTILSCSSAAPWCPVAAVGMACACLPLIDKDAAAHPCW